MCAGHNFHWETWWPGLFVCMYNFIGTEFLVTWQLCRVQNPKFIECQGTHQPNRCIDAFLIAVQSITASIANNWKWDNPRNLSFVRLHFFSRLCFVKLKLLLLAIEVRKIKTCKIHNYCFVGLLWNCFFLFLPAEKDYLTYTSFLNKVAMP